MRTKYTINWKKLDGYVASAVTDLLHRPYIQQWGLTREELTSEVNYTILNDLSRTYQPGTKSFETYCFDWMFLKTNSRLQAEWQKLMNEITYNELSDDDEEIDPDVQQIQKQVVKMEDVQRTSLMTNIQNRDTIKLIYKFAAKLGKLQIIEVLIGNKTEKELARLEGVSQSTAHRMVENFKKLIREQV